MKDTSSQWPACGPTCCGEDFQAARGSQRPSETVGFGENGAGACAITRCRFGARLVLLASFGGTESI